VSIYERTRVPARTSRTLSLVEHDISLAADEVTKLDRRITVVTGDGAQGYSLHAPYDRIEATCSVGTVPYSWVEQTRPGGIILTPWGPPFDNNHLLRLQVDDGMASGTIVGWAAFMRLRGQRWTVTDKPANFTEIAQTSQAVIDPRELLGDDAQLAVGLHLGQCRAAWIMLRTAHWTRSGYSLLIRGRR
jgi:hypothetical protein